jgi:molecular chaperone HtpG
MKKKKQKEEKTSFEILCKKMKEILGDKVEEVMIGDRMIDSPATLVTTEYGWSANMQRIMKAQVLRDGQMSSFMVGKKKMEINPKHAICRELRKKLEKDETDRTVKDLVQLLFETALLTSGFTLEEPTIYATRIYKLIKLGLSIEDEEEKEVVEKEEIPKLDEKELGNMEEVD